MAPKALERMKRTRDELRGLGTEALESIVGTAVESMTDEQITKVLAVLGSEQTKRSASEIVAVTVDNFVEAETARMFDGCVLLAGGINRWGHNREPVALDKQNVIRMNRDTLYSSAVVDISHGATVTLPDAGDRYMSLMVVNEGHYINAVYHDEGKYELTVDDFDSNHVLLVLRTFVDPNDPKDLDVVHDLQDAVRLEAGWAKPYEHPVYDEESRKKIHSALLVLNETGTDAARTFGKKTEVDPVRHLLGTAAGWGGLPETEAFYVAQTEPQPVGRFSFNLKEVPFDGFWSVSIYNRDGFFEENHCNSYSANNVTAFPNDDGTVTLNLAPDGEGLINHLYIMDGWNYVLRIYRPHPEVVDGTWAPPTPEMIG